MNAIHDDEDLLERLRAICEEVDPTPDLVIEMARAAFSLRRLDAELAELVLDSADAAWRNRGVADGGPLFGPQWTVPARPPGPGLPEQDLSVQLSGWMLLEAAAVLSDDEPG